MLKTISTPRILMYVNKILSLKPVWFDILSLKTQESFQYTFTVQRKITCNLVNLVIIPAHSMVKGFIDYSGFLPLEHLIKILPELCPNASWNTQHGPWINVIWVLTLIQPQLIGQVLKASYLLHQVSCGEAPQFWNRIIHFNTISFFLVTAHMGGKPLL